MVTFLAERVSFVSFAAPPNCKKCGGSVGATRKSRAAQTLRLHVTQIHVDPADAIKVG